MEGLHLYGVFYCSGQQCQYRDRVLLSAINEGFSWVLESLQNFSKWYVKVPNFVTFMSILHCTKELEENGWVIPQSLLERDSEGDWVGSHQW